MNRKKGVLTAGALTGLLLIALLALGFGNLQAKSTDATAVAPAAIENTVPQTTGMTTDQAIQAWQDYSAQLEQTVRTMQQRETAYQQQLDAANQTILQLQDQINSLNSAPSTSFFGEHESHERGEFGGFND
ncbi:MAG: hypothetical protein P8183_05615 [Anaerolineae bacterium]|jgi:apolipoprotein N-acyltransferase